VRHQRERERERRREERFQTAVLQTLKPFMKPKISVFFWGDWNFHIFFELKNKNINLFTFFSFLFCLFVCFFLPFFSTKMKNRKESSCFSF